MNFKRKIQLGIATATGMLVVGIVAVPSVTNVLHAASDSVSLVSQTAALRPSRQPIKQSRPSVQVGPRETTG